MVGPLKFIGLTGGIGSGKSTVAAMIRQLGVPVIDADVLARQVVAKGTPALAEIAALWPHAIRADGELDRGKLAATVFSDPKERARLEAITHPRIHQRALAEARTLADAGHRLAFYEASLLVETGRHTTFDGLVVVAANEAQQVARAVARGGLTREQASDRLRAQFPLAEKQKVATHVIDNSGDLASTRQAVTRMVDQLRAGS